MINKTLFKNYRKRVSLFLFLMVMSYTLLFARPGNNPVQVASLGGNPGFENNLTDWTFSNNPSYSSTTSGKRSGAKCLKLITTSVSDLTASFSGQPIAAPSGTTYVTVLFWYKGSGTNGSVDVGIYNSTTSTLTTSGSPVITSTTLTSISYSFAVNVGDTYYPVLIGKSTNGASTTIYYDDVVFYFNNSSSPDVTIPVAPSHLTATTSGTSITITWDAGSDAESGIDGYLLLRQSLIGTSTNVNPLVQCNYSTTSTEGPATLSTYTVVYNGGNVNTFTDDPGATGIYTYMLYTRDKAYNYNTGANAARIYVFNGSNLSGTTAASTKLDGLYLPATDTLIVSAGTITIRAGADIKVDGVIKEQGNITNSLGGLIEFRNGSMYHFNRNGSTTALISPVTWSPGSLCKIDAITTTAPSGLGQTFYDLTWNCTAQNVNVTFPSSGFQVNGTFSVQSTGATAKKITLSNSTFNGNVLMTGGTVDCAAATTINLTGSERQIFCITGPAQTLVLNNTANAIIGNNLTINTNLQLTFGTFYDSTFTITIANNGKITNAGGALDAAPTFSGVTDLVYNTSSTTGMEVPSGNVRNLTVNTSGTVILNSAITMTGALTFTSGIIQTTGTNLLSLAAGATVSGASSTSYVDGPVKKIGNTAFTFPIGDNGNYKPLTITAPAVITDAFTATYLNANPSATYDTSMKVAPVDHVSLAEYYLLDQTAGTSSVQITLSFDANSGGINNLSDLIVAHWYGGQWISEGNAATTGTTSSGTIKSNSVSSFSPFAIGSKSSNNPLPVEMIDFTAECNQNNVLLRWSTASENNNNFFIVERSLDNETFSWLSKVPGNGTSNAIHNYVFEDTRSSYNNLYYRLKQTDFNGKSSYFGPVTIKCENTGDNTPEIFYQPNTQEITIMAKTTGKNLITIYDISGKKLSEEWVGLNKGINTVSLKKVEQESGCRIISITNASYSNKVSKLIPPVH